MPRRNNPGPFEPLLYLLQTPTAFRIVGIGGMALFTIEFLRQAGAAGAGYALLGLGLLGALWLESSLIICRRCRFYGTWHCLGQGMLVSRMFPRQTTGLAPGRAQLHFALIAAYLVYGLFWLWHAPVSGLLFTLWLPLLIVSARTRNGFSWNRPPVESRAA